MRVVLNTTATSSPHAADAFPLWVYYLTQLVTVRPFKRRPEGQWCFWVLPISPVNSYTLGGRRLNRQPVLTSSYQFPCNFPP